MLNSILMLGSTYNKNKKINVIFAIAWIIYMLIGSNLTTEIGLKFTIMNFVSFAFIFGLGKIFKGKYSNKVLSISSILIWSVVIDIICYFLYPQFTIGQNIITYISNGILFNYKYLLTNSLIVGAISLVPILGKVKNKYIETQLQLETIKAN